MDKLDVDFPISYMGYDTDYIDEVLIEKDRIISTQFKDLESLKREIVDLKKKINCSKRKKKR